METDSDFRGFGAPRSSWWKPFLGVAAVLAATPVLIPPLLLAVALVAPFAIFTIPVMVVTLLLPKPEERTANERVRLLQWELATSGGWHPRHSATT